MSFLDIVRDPLQRLSDSCSRVMVAMERELVAGLNVEQDRLERIRRRNAQRADAIRAAEAILAEEEKTAVNGTTTTPNATGGEMPCGETAKKQDLGHITIFNRIRVLFGIEPRHLSQEDIEYAEALKSGMVKEGKKKKTKPKLSKKGLATDTVHHNKFLQQNAQRNATSSGIDEGDDDFMLPPDMSYVQYLTQELEIFDKAEAEGLRNFISTHPTLDVGPREELFLIFFFLFALREIARELVRLGKYVEELEEKERQKMEEEGRVKRRKQLWWPKVIGNFWNWFAWGSYSQVKTTEGYNSLIMNTTKHLEHRQPGSIEEEKALVEAKAAKAAAEKLATEAATAKATAEKQAERRRRRHSEMWDIPPLRRSTTLSTFIHRQGRIPDLEMGLGDNHHQMEMEEEERPQRRHVRRHSQGPRSRSNSPMRRRTTWSRQGDPRHRGRKTLNEDSEHNSSIRGEKHTMQQEADLGDPSVLGGKEVLNEEFGEEVGCSSRSVPQNSASTKPKSRLAEQYTVVEIPAFESLQHGTDKDLKHFEDVRLVHLSPRINVVKPHSSAPPEMDVSNTFKLQKKTSRGVILSAPSSSHQDRYPSFASSTSPALLNRFHNSDSTAANSQGTEQQLNASKEYLEGLDGNESSTGSEVSIGDRHRRSCPDRKNTKDGKRRSRGLFVSFSRRPSDEISESSTKQQQQSPPVLEPVKQPRRMFVSVSKPKTWRYRFWELLQPFKSEEFKFGFKMAVGLTFIGMWSWLHWTNVALATDRGQWAMMTVMAVLSPTVGATFSVCAMRVAGTLAGTLWALITYLVLPKDPWVICVMMLFVSFAGVFIILESSNANLGIIMLLSYSSITFIMYEGRSTETIYEVCYKRAITVIVGILVAVILNSLLWPILARRELRKEIAILIGRQGVLFAELVSKFLLEDPRDHQWEEQPHYLTKWSGSDQDDEDEYNGDKLDEKATAMETLQDGLQESFIERAEREDRNEKLELSRQRKRKVGKIDGQGAISGVDTTNKGDLVNALRHQMEDPRNVLDPDRLAFQHVEQQLQTKLIKISELLVLSGSEPRLKEEFPMKLYQQIIQCCQNILDRMISMRMAAQLLSPEVRELVTGPMNYYRRDMVGALLLYFSVLSSSLASKSPLPPYLPSARIARLRVIYNVREAIAAHQATTGENHYTYIYYYAFSSALEEVIEELELLAILIKPIVGVMLVSSGTSYAYALPTGQLNLGAMATGQLSLSTAPDPQPSSIHPHEQHLGVGGRLAGNLPTLAGLPAATMINIGMSNSTTAGQGAGAFGQQLQYPQDLIYEQQRRLEQQQAHQQHQQLQLQIQLQAQQNIIQQQQQQLLLQQQQLGLSFHPDLAIAAPSRILSPQIVSTTAACPVSGDSAIGSSAAAAVSTTSLSSSGSSGSHDSRKNPQGTPTIPSMAKRRSSKPFGLKVATDGPKVDISPPTAGGTTGSQILTVDPTNSLLAGCATMATSPIMMMDESLLSNRHAQRYKEAIQVAQEASGQQVIEVTPSAEAVPTQIQFPTATVAASPSVAGGNNNISPLATTTATVPVIAISPAASNPLPATRKRLSIVGGFSFGSKEADNNDNDRNGRRPSFHFHRHRHHKSHDSTRSLKNPLSASMEMDAEGMETEVRSIASSPLGSGMTTEAPLSLDQIPVASAELELGQHGDRASQNETQRK
ncbi:MAG: aluminum activated malate transporter-domain-containing protein [Benniella sp.]|nr:MAG: aluminum activated malate transporter-domain-containing protein [Benniella sp.]